MNFEIVLIQIVIGILIGLVLIKLFQTKKSISYEKRLGTYSVNSIKDNELSYLDQVHLFFYGLIKSVSKFLSRFKSMKKRAKKYNKYISYANKDEYEAIDLLAIKYLVLITAVSVTIIFSLAKFHQLNYLLIISSFLSFYILDIVVKIDFQRKRKEIEDDLLKAIMIMNNSFKSGRTIIQALEAVNKELQGPIEDEFKKILVDVRYGLSLDVAFKRFYQRIELEDARYVTTSLILLNKTGGSISNLFNNIEANILTKRRLKDELSSLTSAARLMYKTLVILPIFMVLIILLLNKGYFKPFINSPVGIILLMFVLILYVSYIVVVRNIFKVNI